MTSPNNYKRPAFPKRPWIMNALYDTLARGTVLHCDAYVRETDEVTYLELSWRQGGRKIVALDFYMIAGDGLHTLTEGPFLSGSDVFWSRLNNAQMARVHKSVLARVAEVEAAGTWSRVSVQCHYIHVRDVDGEIPAERNKYRPPRPYAPRKGKEPARTTLPDWL